MKKLTRRQFIRAAGMTAAMLMLGRTAYAGISSATPRGMIRRCWLQMAEIERKSNGTFSDRDKKKLESILDDHSLALDALVKRKALDRLVAEQIDTALRTDFCHNAPGSRQCHADSSFVICYYMLEPPLWKQGIDELSKQAEILVKSGWIWPLDADLVAQARANVERDLAALVQSSETEKAARFLLDVLFGK